MCLSPKFAIHPYMPLALMNAKECFVLGEQVDKNGLANSLDFSLITSQLSIQFSEINQEAINYLCDSSYIITRDGHLHSIFIQLKCHNCKECRYEYQKDIVNRSILEASVSSNVFFATLTYDNEHVPLNGLQKHHVSASLKRLRSHCERYLRSDFQFVTLFTGEYGADLQYTLRPHYHILIFLKTDITEKEQREFFSFFLPSNNKNSFYYKFNKAKKEAIDAKSKEKGKDYKFKPLEHFWPYGLRFDIQKPKSSIPALTAYTCKYVSKSLIESDEEHIIARESVRYPLKSQFSDGIVRECHQNPPFVQLPKKIGLGVSALDNYADFILKSNRSDIYVNCHGHLHRMAVPHIFYKKLFPTLGSLKSNIVFNVRLFTELFHIFSYKLSKGKQFLSDTSKLKFENLLNIFSDYVTRFKKISCLHMHHRLTRQLETELHIAQVGMSLHVIADWMQAIIDDFLIDCPDDSVLDELYTNKLTFLNNLPPPALDWTQRSIYKSNQSNKSFYKLKKIAYGEFDQVR